MGELNGSLKIHPIIIEAIIFLNILLIQKLPAQEYLIHSNPKLWLEFSIEKPLLFTSEFYILWIFILITGSVIYPQLKRLEADKKESSITYYLKHPLHEVESVSKDADCLADIDPVKKEINGVEVQVDVTSFDSGNSNRDSHAMEVIDALDYPYATFLSIDITQNGDSLKVKGKLTFHGISKDIIISAFPEWTQKKLTVSGKFNISLTAFKVERPFLLMIPVEDNLRFYLVEVFNL